MWVGDADYDRYEVSTFDDTDDEDAAPAPAPAPAAPAQPPDVVGKRIDVKYYNSGNRSFVVNRGSIRRRKKSSGTFYEGKVLRYNQQTRRHTVEFDDVLFCGWLDAIPSPPKASHGLLQGSVSLHHATSRLAARRMLPFGVQHSTTNATSAIHVAASGMHSWQLRSRGRGVWQAQPPPDARGPERVFQLALFAHRVQ